MRNMYDRIKMYLIASREGEFANLPSLLTNAEQRINVQTGEVTTFGYIENVRVTIKPTSLFLDGSLAKYLYGGSNLYPLDRHTSKEALTSLSDALHISLAEANLSLIEFGYNFLMQYPPQEYLNLLGDMKNRQRYRFNLDSLYYRRKGKSQPDEFKIYNKVEDAKRKKMEIPTAFSDANLLRAELCLDKKIAKQLRVPEAKAHNLYERDFYLALKEKFLSCYFSINKLSSISVEFTDEEITPKEGLYAILGFALALLGDGQEIVNKAILQMKAEGRLKGKNDLGRLRQMATKALTMAKRGEENPLLRELNDCFINLKANAP